MYMYFKSSENLFGAFTLFFLMDYDIKKTETFIKIWPFPMLVLHEFLRGLAGHLHADLHHVEVPSHTVIRLERGFIATGQSRQWLLLMMGSLASGGSRKEARGLEMLQHCGSQPLSEDDWRPSPAFSCTPQPDFASQGGKLPV